jgi:hypothetical protein
MQTEEIRAKRARKEKLFIGSAHVGKNTILNFLYNQGCIYSISADIIWGENKKEDNVKEYGEMTNDKGEIEVKRVKYMQKGQK